MALLVFSRQCAECKNEKELRLVNIFASQHKLKVIVKRTLISQANRDEAERLSDVDLPYIYNEDTHTALHLRGVTATDLQHLL